MNLFKNFRRFSINLITLKHFFLEIDAFISTLMGLKLKITLKIQ